MFLLGSVGVSVPLNEIDAKLLSPSESVLLAHLRDLLLYRVPVHVKADDGKKYIWIQSLSILFLLMFKLILM